jgi:hypothetical protein
MCKAASCHCHTFVTVNFKIILTNEKIIGTAGLRASANTQDRAAASAASIKKAGTEAILYEPQSMDNE